MLLDTNTDLHLIVYVLWNIIFILLWFQRDICGCIFVVHVFFVPLFHFEKEIRINLLNEFVFKSNTGWNKVTLRWCSLRSRRVTPTVMVRSRQMGRSVCKQSWCKDANEAKMRQKKKDQQVHRHIREFSYLKVFFFSFFSFICLASFTRVLRATRCGWSVTWRREIQLEFRFSQNHWRPGTKRGTDGKFVADVFLRHSYEWTHEKTLASRLVRTHHNVYWCNRR